MTALLLIFLDLHCFKRCERHLPLGGLEARLSAVVIEVGLHIDHEVRCKHNESPLVEEVRVSLHDEGVELVAL